MTWDCTDRHIAKDPTFRRRVVHKDLRGSLGSLSYSLVQTSSKFPREKTAAVAGSANTYRDHRATDVPRFAGGHPAPPKNRDLPQTAALGGYILPLKRSIFPEKGSICSVCARRKLTSECKKHKLKGAAETPELHQLVERNHATDEPAFHLLLETTLKPTKETSTTRVEESCRSSNFNLFRSG